MGFEGFTGWTDISAAGLLALAILLILMGKLVPRSVVDQIRTDRDQQLTAAREEISNWRTAYMASEESRSLQSQQVAELLELGRKRLPAASEQQNLPNETAKD